MIIFALGKASHRLIVVLLTISFLILTPITAWAAYPIDRPVLPADDGINTYYYGEGSAIHKGIDFSNVTLGDSVLATAPSTVVDYVETYPNGCDPTWPVNDPRYCNAYGNYVLVRHNQQHYDRVSGTTGWVYTLYLHLQQNGVLVNVNNNVAAGQQIGQGDDTGNSTANHLHFQLIIHNLSDRVLANIDSENRTRNPELWLKPLSNTARLAGKVTTNTGAAIPNLTITGLQKAVGAITLLTYNNAALKSDDILVENFATTDITPGTYCVQAKSGTTLYKDFGCNNNFIAGQTTYIGLYPVYLPDVRGNLLGGWTSSITVRYNSTTDTAKVNTTFFNSGGSVASQRVDDSIPPNGNLTFAAPGGLGNGSAIVVASQDVAVLTVHEIGSGSTYATEAYPGVDRPSADVHIPIVQKNNSGANNPSFWNSYVYVQNAGNADANVAVEFFPTAGSGNYYIYNENNVAPGEVRRIDVSTKLIGVARPDFPGTLKFVGSMHLSNAQNQPLAVASTQYKGSTLLMETSNTQPPANTLYAPLIQNNNNGIVSGLALRSTTSGGNFNVQYYNSSNGAWCYTEPATPGNPDPLMIPTAPTNNACLNLAVLTAVFQVSNSMVANVNQLKTTTNATTYAAIATPARTAIIPKVRNSGGWGDGFTIMNTGNANATITVQLYNADGTVNATGTANLMTINNTPLAPRQSAVVLGQIPAGFNGSAVVTSSQPLAVQANSRNAGVSGDFMGSYPAIHR